MTTARTDIEDELTPRSECWCCGAVGDSEGMVHLGNHPEVALCLRCSHYVAKQARGIEDRGKHGPAVAARDAFRSVRREVVRRGWQHSRLFGGPIRWIGKRMP